MWNVVELFQTGVLVDLVVDLEQLGLEGKMLIKSILGETYSNLEDHQGQRSQEYATIGMGTGIEKNPVKGEGIERENGKSLMSALMTDQGIMIIGRIGTTETATGTETEIGRETGAVIVIADVTEIVAGTVVGNMSVIVTVLERGRGIGKEIMNLGTLTMSEDVPVVESTTMTLWNQNMSEIGMVRGRGTMIMLSRRMILNGMNSVITGIGIQKLSMTMDTTSILNTIIVENHSIQSISIKGF